MFGQPSYEIEMKFVWEKWGEEGWSRKKEKTKRELDIGKVMPNYSYLFVQIFTLYIKKEGRRKAK